MYLKIGLAVALIAILVSTFFLGVSHGDSVRTKAANTEIQTLKDSHSAEVLAAVKRGAEAQKAADAQAIEEQKAEALRQSQAAATAAAKAQEIASRNDQLTHDIQRLKSHDQAVAAFADACLPPALLRSLHGAANEAVDGRCR